MAYSFISYTGNGSTTDFSITFPYLAPYMVFVFVDGVQKTNGVDYTIISSSIIRFTVAPSNGAVITIKRSSSPNVRLTNFQDSSILTEEALDFDSNQTFYVAQEAFDAAANAIQLTNDNTYSANSRRISNLLSPVNPSDAIPKDYADNYYGGASAVAAASSASQAASSASAAATSASQAASSASAAAASAAQAAGNANGERFVRGLLGFTWTASTFQCSAFAWGLVDASGSRVIINNQTTLTVDLALAGPIANGRDRVGDFTSGFVNVFAIWGATPGLAGIVSPNLPKDGPVLPSGYTHWCYLNTLHIDASPNTYTPCSWSGNKCTYNYPFLHITGGTPTTNATFVINSSIPPFSNMGLLEFTLAITGTPGTECRLIYGVTGVAGEFAPVILIPQTAYGIQSVNTFWAFVGNQSLYYRLSSVPTSGGAYINVRGFEVPNGA
jgi:hypothetical protein